MTAEAEASTVRTFDVLLGNRSRVELALAALAKRAARRHLPLVTWTWGKPFTTKERTPHPEYGWEVKHEEDVTRIPLHLPCGPACYAGWTFLGALQHLDGENVVRAVPGAEVPVQFRSRGPVCDHCKHARRRNDTYVLRHEDGRVMQVGSTCIGDFLGSDEAGKVAAQASMLAELRGLAEGACEGSCGPSADRTLAEYLPFVAWCVRVQGWTSRTAVREKGEGVATADWAWTFLTDGKARADAGAEIASAAARGLARGRPLRLFQAGDARTERAARVLAEAARAWLRAGGSAAWGYTHSWRDVPRDAWRGVSMLASVESTADGLRAWRAGYVPARVVAEHAEGGRTFEEGGITWTPCPEQTRGTACVNCRLCFDDDKLRGRGTGITFAAHGAHAKKLKRRLPMLGRSRS